VTKGQHIRKRSDQKSKNGSPGKKLWVRMAGVGKAILWIQLRTKG